MKLHLPKQLFTALLATITLATPQSMADSVSVNFYKGDDDKISTAEGTLFGVNASAWNDVTATGAQTQNLSIRTAEGQSLILTLTTPQQAWESGNSPTALEDKLQNGYLDLGSNNQWTITLDTDFWISDVTFYMAGDGGQFSPISVNGISYKGGCDNESNEAWGNRGSYDDTISYSKTEGYNGTTAISNGDLNEARAVRVTSLVGGLITASNVPQNDSSKRGTIGGFQVVDVTDSKVYAATLGSNEVSLSDVSWSKQGVETTSTLANISESERFLSVTAGEAGSKLDVAANTTIAGLQLVANNLTVDGSGTLTVGALRAKNGSTLTMNAALAGESLVLSGSGTISLKDFAYTGEVSVLSSTTVQLQSGTRSAGSFVNHGTVQLVHGVTPGVKISNSGRVELQMGSNVVALNNLVGQNWGTYKPAVIENTSTGDFVIVNTGNMSLSGDITIGNGGKVTLKGGTFGTETAAITNKISSSNTILVLDGVQSYLGKNTADQILSINTELTNGSVLHLLGNDRFNYGGSYTMTVGHDSLLDVGSSCQRLSGNTLKLAGGTVYGNGGANTEGSYTAGLDYHQSGTIAVTEDSLIATTVASRDADDVVTLDVAANKTLTIGSYTAGETTYTGSFVGSGAFTKSGSGTVLYKGAEFTNNLTISSGVFEYYLEDERTLSGSISGSGSFTKSGSGTLTLSGANTYTGTTTINGGKLLLNLGQDYTLLNTVSGSGTLQVESGTTLVNNGKRISSKLVLNGGNATISGDQTLSADVTLEAGSTLTFSNGDAVHYDKDEAINFVVKSDAKVNFGATRQAFTDGSILELAGGTVTGVGDDYGAIDMKDYATFTIKATQDSEMDATVRLRDGATIKFDVAEGKTLTAKGVLKNRGTDASQMGKFTKIGSGELVLEAANTYTGGTTIEAGTVTTKNAAALGTGGVTMTGGILNVTDVTDVADADPDLTVGGAIVMNADATAKLATSGTTLSLGTTGSVKKTNADGTQHVIIASDGTNAASMTAKTQNAQLVQLAQLAQDASFTIQDMTLTNTTVTAATVETKVNLQNVEDSTALLAKGAFTLNATPTVGKAPTAESRGTLSYSNGLAIATDGNASLTLNLDVVNAVAGDAHGTYDLTITLSGFGANFAVTEDIRKMVSFDSTSWLGQALGSQKAAEYNTVVTEQTPATAGESGVPTVSYAAGTGANVGSLVITIAGLNVPEPTTATLSLLALAALAARRRRND